MKNPSLKPTPLLLACFASLCFSSTISFAQTEKVKYERLTTENGLSSNVVFSIFQDKHGYLWVGTNDGLNRYDGYTFQNYRSDPTDSFSINSNHVAMICEDRFGKLWISTTTGVCQYNYEKNNFIRINPPTEKIIGGFVNLFGDELLINTKNGWQFLNVLSLQTTPLKFPGQYRHLTFDYTITTTDKSGNLYYSLVNKDTTVVLKYDLKTKSSEFVIDLRDNPFIRGPGRIYFVDSRGCAWIGTDVEGRIYHKKFSSANFELIRDNVGAVNQIMEDRSGNIWFATTRSLFRYDHSTKRIIQINYHETDQTNSSILTNTIYRDGTGLMWIGSYRGLFKFNPSANQFGHFSTSKTSLRLKDNFILGLYPLQGNQVVAYYQWGIRQYSIIDLDKNNIKHHRLGDRLSNHLFWENFVENKHFSDPLAWKKFSNTNLPYTGSLPAFIIFDKHKKLWRGAADILGYYGDDDFSGDEYILDLNSTIMDCRISGDRIWTATEGEGLSSLDVVSHHTKKYVVTGDHNGLNNNSLTSLLIEPAGDLWIGTKGGGLNYFDQQTGKFKYYTTKEGLCNNSVFNLVKDDKQRLWIGTANGISCFDPKTGKFKNFFTSDGVHNSEYNRYSACKLDNGYLMIGGFDGIDYFHPDSVFTPSIKPTVQITDFKVFNRSVFRFSCIRLAHDKNYVTIDFAAMDFRNPSANKFEYKLEGIDKDWVDAGSKHSISYATLSPGSYHFLVRGAGSDGEWSKEAAIDFIILTPWWKTIWFYSVCAFIVAVILFWFYKYRIRQLKKLMQLRTKISQDLHDDVGATLSGIRVFSQLAKERPGNNSEYIDKITTYSDDMLNKLGDIVWSINAENDSFSHMISRLRNYAQTMTTAKNIRLEFYIDPIMEKKDLDITLRKNIYMITREAINNAVKYAECSSLRISLKPASSGAELIIADNGKGFDNNKVRAGNGLTNMQKRAEEMQNTLQVETKPGAGVSIKLFFKFT